MRYFTTRAEGAALDDALRDEVRGEFVTTGAGLTHYELRGPARGELVLLVGGLTVPLYYWDRFAIQLHAHGYRTLAFSLYGRGYSDRVATTYDEALLVGQIAGLCAALDVQPRHVVGSSLGALVAMSYVRDHSPAVDSVSLVGPAGMERRLPRGAGLLRYGSLGWLLGKVVGDRMLEQHLGHNVEQEALAAQLSEMVRTCYRVDGSLYSLCSTVADYPLVDRHDLYRDHRSSGVPTLLVWGAEDDVTPIGRLPEVETLLGPSHTHVIGNCGHMASFERPADVAAVFTTFLTSLSER
ncbi:alpha/beta fold hydrolase [Gordonia hankookensis]|uniref:Alpha/beta fold hydrolase n=1 Tax=Gordonia hankookensis TaxID=589403 RepID=A0ABR7WI34_9ACTN|nr:alpha/beta fold hydrolase [Gordonia hankookensis]MBD1322168.1 alpha/beta fold hydrolase [Gordonia hankookensis]